MDSVTGPTIKKLQRQEQSAWWELLSGHKHPCADFQDGRQWEQRHGQVIGPLPVVPSFISTISKVSMPYQNRHSRRCCMASKRRVIFSAVLIGLRRSRPPRRCDSRSHVLISYPRRTSLRQFRKLMTIEKNKKEHILD